MTYEKSVKYLYKIAGFAKKSSLDDIKYFLEQLGNPQNDLKFVHVAGTNGKGSVCAFLEAILKEHGKTTASFTSPHLVRVNERIKVNGEEVSDQEFANACTKVRNCIEEAQKKEMDTPSFFECLFLMALLIFQKNKPDVCMIETGMGGRYDATNVITPLVSVITSISMDHMEFLGTTIEEIASHKAGIIKEGIPVVTMRQEESVSRIIKEETKMKMSPIYDVSEDNLKFKENASKYIDFLNVSAYDKRRDVRTNIAGDFQVANLLVALKSTAIICQQIDTDKIFNALTKIKIPGRMEEIAPGIIVDVSHNIQGMEGFVQTVEANFHGKKRILFAASHKNEEEYMKDILKEIKGIEAFYTVAINNRRIKEEEFQNAFHKMIEERENDTVCFVVGSFYLAGMAKDLINQEENDVKL